MRVKSDRSADSGFLTVLAPIILRGLPLCRAVGVLVVSVAANSYAGFAGYAQSIVIHNQMVDILAMTTAAVTFAVTTLLKRLSAEKKTRPASRRSLRPWRPISCSRILRRGVSR